MDNTFVFTADAAIPLLWKFLNRWPSAEQARRAEKERIAKMLQPLGLHETRAATIIRFSGQHSLHVSLIFCLRLLGSQYAPSLCWRVCVGESGTRLFSCVLLV